MPTIVRHPFWALVPRIARQSRLAWEEAIEFAARQYGQARGTRSLEQSCCKANAVGYDIITSWRYKDGQWGHMQVSGRTIAGACCAWFSEATRNLTFWSEPQSEAEDNSLFSLEGTLALGHLLATSPYHPHEDDPADNPVPLLWDVALAWREWTYEVLRTRDWQNAKKGPLPRRLRLRMDLHVGTYGIVQAKNTMTLEAAVCLRSSVQGPDGLVQIAQQAQAHMAETPWLDTAHEGNVQDAADRLSDAIRALYAYAMACGATPPPDAPRY
ncbi:MAG: hypothetical protein IT477_10420 [Rhodanobacteraceae bacterium]|nr:hypothetical protein [Rhodanobacteraceae bacterium]